MTTENNSDSWAIVELMGHVALAGRVALPGEYGGLWQIDIPIGDSFRTEFFGSQSVYRIRMVSEEIARAYAPRHEVIEYNAPIITRDEHLRIVERYQERISEMQQQINRLRLPAGEVAVGDGPSVIEFDEDDGDEEELPF